MRWIRYFAQLFAFTSLSVFVLLFLLAELVEYALTPSRDTVSTMLSPSGKAQAVLEELNGGATTSFGYAVYLEPVVSSAAHRGVRVASAYGALRSEEAYGLTLVWPDPTTLEIQYHTAQDIKLLAERVSVGSEMVTVRLRAGISDPKAPPGGMLYNLQGRPPLE